MPRSRADESGALAEDVEVEAVGRATAGRAARSGRRGPSRRRLGRRESAAGWIFTSPALLVLILLNTFPLIYSILISFSRVDTSTGLEFGERTLSNWSGLLQDSQFWGSLQFTVIFTVLAVASEYVLGLALALLLREKLAGGGFFRVLFAIPMMLTPVAIGFMWRMLYDQSNGPINAALGFLGLGSPGWLSDRHLAVVSVVIMDVWEWTPLVFLLLLAGLQSIGSELIDAARVDGASGWQIITRIILPLLAPVSVTAVFLRMIDSFQVFGQIFLLTGGGPGTATTSTTLFGFFQGFQSFDLGYGAAIALSLLVLVIVVSTLFLSTSRRLLQRVEA
ncbi:MAG: sugar ABC transporter permease [Microlunatus sp.]|nr:sugar ABC transporter permease [Microlunatus sp.]